MAYPKKLEDKLWEKVRTYNNLSHVYSMLADELVKMLNEAEEDGED